MSRSDSELGHASEPGTPRNLRTSVAYYYAYIEVSQILGHNISCAISGAACCRLRSTARVLWLNPAKGLDERSSGVIESEVEIKMSPNYPPMSATISSDNLLFNGLAGPL